MSTPPAKKQKTTMRICTHSGSFHADESLAIYLLKLLPRFSGATLVRSRNPADWEESDIVVDVGGKYDGGVKWFDHHQREFNESFSQDFHTKLSSAGLIYKHFGKEIIEETLKLNSASDIDMLYVKIYKEFIEAVDANDNGINNYDSSVEKKFNDKNLTLPSLVSQLNPRWNTNPTDKDYDEAFLTASELMGRAFLNLVKGYGESWLPARDIVEKAFKDRKNVHPSGEVIVLEQFCPWKEHLYSIEKENNAQGEIKFVLFKDSGNSWRISTVSVTSSSFEFRFGLPEPWRGVRDEELSKLTGVDGCVFVHAAGFIGGCKTKEGVLELAKLALEKLGTGVSHHLTRSHQHRRKQQKTGDDEAKDPLQSKSLGEQLAQAQAEGQHGRGKTHTPVVVHKSHRAWDQQQEPDQHVGHDSAEELVHVQQHGTVPEHGEEQPRHGECSVGEVDQQQVAQRADVVGLVDRVQGQDVGQVQEQEDLGPEVVLTHKERRPAKHKQVEDGEVPADLLGVLHSGGVERAVGGGDKDSGDKQDSHDAQHTKVHHHNHEVDGEGRVANVVWAVSTERSSATEVSQGGVCREDPQDHGGDFVRDEAIHF